MLGHSLSSSVVHPDLFQGVGKCLKVCPVCPSRVSYATYVLFCQHATYKLSEENRYMKRNDWLARPYISFTLLPFVMIALENNILW